MKKFNLILILMFLFIFLSVTKHILSFPLPRYFDLVRDLRHNKGEILKASVDYIRRMKEDQDRSNGVEARMRMLETQNRRYALQIQVI